MDNRITLVIIDYKSSIQTFSCIENIEKNCSNNIKFDYIVVDNTHSNNLKNADIICKYYIEKENTKFEEYEVSIGSYKNIEVTICYTNENLGYAKGNNVGFLLSEWLFGNEYVIFSNNDLIFDEKFDIEKLIEPFQDEKVAVIGPDITDNLGEIHQSPCKNMSFWQGTVVNYYHMISERLAPTWKSNIAYSAKSGVCDWVSGCFIVVRASDFNAIEGFDPGTFLYWEEAILGEKIRKIGKLIWFNNDVKIIHNHSTVVRKSYSEIERLRLNYQSSIYYYSKYKEISILQKIFSRILFELFVPLFWAKNVIKLNH